LVCLAFFPGRVLADLDPGLKTPYQLNVVLHFSSQCLFTPVFQSTVKGELQTLLEQTYGDLAQVQIFQHHALLKDIQQKGLQQALDSWDEISGLKHHFVLIDSNDG